MSDNKTLQDEIEFLRRAYSECQSKLLVAERSTVIETNEGWEIIKENQELKEQNEFYRKIIERLVGIGDEKK